MTNKFPTNLENGKILFFLKNSPQPVTEGIVLYYSPSKEYVKIQSKITNYLSEKIRNDASYLVHSSAHENVYFASPCPSIERLLYRKLKSYDFFKK
jgi:hypothetical protein